MALRSCLLMAVLLCTPVAVRAQTVTEAAEPVSLNLLAQGKQAYQQQDYTQAVLLLLQALQTGEQAEIYYYLGLSYYNLGMFSLATEAFESARLLYAEAVPADLLFSLGLSAYYAHEVERAQEYLNHVLNHPQATPELKRLAEEQLLMTLRDQSSAYQQALETYQSGQYAEALAAFKEVLVLLPDSAEIYYYMGIAAYQIADYEQARQYLERTLALNPASEYADSAQQTLDVVDKLASNLPLRPFTGSVSLGQFGDSNVNYGDARNNRINQGVENSLSLDPALQDLGSSLNLSLNYAFDQVTSLRYNYLLNLYWGLNPSQENQLNSYDYNFQQHYISLFQRIPVLDWVELYLDTHSSLQVLAGQIFLAEGGLRPTLTFYESERLITRAFVDLGAERYLDFQERDNFNYGLGLDQYIYLWNSRSWLRFNYRFAHVLARDSLRSQIQEGTNQVFETEFLAASSRSQNQLGLGFAFPLGPLDMELGTRFDFLLYNNPDIYRQYRWSLDPRTGLPLPRAEVQNFEKYREDTRLTFYLNGQWKIARDWLLVARYNRITNISNISLLEIPTLTSRSYLKDVLEVSLQYQF